MRVIVNDWEMALLYRDGRYVGPLAAGAHRISGWFAEIEIKRMPRQRWMQEQNIDVVSADRFPCRLSVGAMCEVTDAKLANDSDYLVRARLALISAAAQAAAGLPLDRLMIERAELAGAVNTLVGQAVPGCALTDAQVVGLTLPPEIRRLFTDVERARREGEAALERARAEHAALRALANAARLLRGNPELMNLRLLQSVSGGPKSATLVLGGNALSVVSPAVANEGGTMSQDGRSDA